MTWLLGNGNPLKQIEKLVGSPGLGWPLTSSMATLSVGRSHLRHKTELSITNSFARNSGSLQALTLAVHQCNHGVEQYHHGQEGICITDQCVFVTWLWIGTHFDSVAQHLSEAKIKFCNMPWNLYVTLTRFHSDPLSSYLEFNENIVKHDLGTSSVEIFFFNLSGAKTRLCNIPWNLYVTLTRFYSHPTVQISRITMRSLWNMIWKL